MWGNFHILAVISKATYLKSHIRLAWSIYTNISEKPAACMFKEEAACTVKIGASSVPKLRISLKPSNAKFVPLIYASQRSKKPIPVGAESKS